MGRYVITGASRGIGRAVASALSSDGHRVLGLVRSAHSVGAAGLTTVLVADLSDPATIAAQLEPQLADVGDLDGLVHAAGIVIPGPLSAPSIVADLSEQFAVNVTAVAELTRLLLPALRSGRGTVVFVNSGSGLNVRPPLSAYGASKYALRAYADALRQEEPEVRVSTVFPGRTATRMQRAVRAAEDGEYDETEYLRPETVAGVICSVLALPPDGVITDLTLRPRPR